jgi:hypothetical protein
MRTSLLLCSFLALALACSKSESPPAAAPAPAPAPAAKPAEPAPLDALIARHLEASGGRDRLLATRSMRWVTVEELDGKTTTMTAVRARPNSMRFESSGPEGTVVKAYDGKVGWFQKGTAAAELVDGEKLAGMAHKAAFDDALVDPAARGAKLALSAPGVIEVTYANGGSETRTIDLATGLEQKRTVRWVYDSKAGEKTLAFSDYRNVAGHQVAFRIDFESEGKKGVTTVSQLRRARRRGADEQAGGQVAGLNHRAPRVAEPCAPPSWPRPGAGDPRPRPPPRDDRARSSSGSTAR